MLDLGPPVKWASSNSNCLIWTNFWGLIEFDILIFDCFRELKAIICFTFSPTLTMGVLSFQQQKICSAWSFHPPPHTHTPTSIALWMCGHIPCWWMLLICMACKAHSFCHCERYSISHVGFLPFSRSGRSSALANFDFLLKPPFLFWQL